MAENPEVSIYCVVEDGKLYPVGASIGGYVLPVVDIALEASPNGTKHGTKALTASLSVIVGEASGIVVVDSPEDVPTLQPFPPATPKSAA